MAATVAANPYPALGSTAGVDDIGTAALVAARAQRRRTNGMTSAEQGPRRARWHGDRRRRLFHRHPDRVRCDRWWQRPRRRARQAQRHQDRDRHARPGTGWLLGRRPQRREGRRLADGRDGELQRTRRRERHARHGLADRRRRRQEADRARGLDPEPGRPRTGHPESRRRGHPGRLDELGLDVFGSWGSSSTSGRPSTRPVSAPDSGSRTPASRTPGASTRRSATRR